VLLCANENLPEACVAASHGIVLFRIPQPSAAILAQRIAAILGSRTDWSGQYSVAEEHAVRMRPLK
jgi:hypothetical protein